MSHGLMDLDTTACGNNVKPWHGVGVVVPGLMNSNEAVTLGGLDWPVEKEQAYFGDGAGLFFAAPESFYTVRGDLTKNDPRRVLGTVGKKYHPIQNAEALNILDSLCGESGAKIETVGSLFNGKVVFASALRPENLNVAGEAVEKWLVVKAPHDGSGSVEIFFTPIRVVCNNTLTMAINGARNRAKIRHTKNYQNQIREAVRVLGIGEKYFNKMGDTLTELSQVKISQAFMEAYLNVVFPDPKDAKRSRSARMRDEILDLFNGKQAGGDNPAVKGNANGGIQAVAEWVDHSRGTRVTQGNNASELRMNSVMWKSGADLKSRALETMLICVDAAEDARRASIGKLLDQIDIEDGDSRRQKMISDLMSGIQID